jgi:hypothetical protein
VQAQARLQGGVVTWEYRSASIHHISSFISTASFLPFLPSQTEREYMGQLTELINSPNIAPSPPPMTPAITVLPTQLSMPACIYIHSLAKTPSPQSIPFYLLRAAPLKPHVLPSLFQVILHRFHSTKPSRCDSDGIERKDAGSVHISPFAPPAPTFPP